MQVAVRKDDLRKIASRYKHPEVEHAYWLARSMAGGEWKEDDSVYAG